jgi:protein-S-isoprenylcysteine O-methyltransferase
MGYASVTMSPQLAGALLMFGFGAMEFFMRQGETAKSVARTATDRGTSILIVATYALAVVAISTKLLPTIGLPGVVPWVGIGVGLVGIVLRVWAMRVLGRFYTRRLVTTADQHVVQEGPYRIVRHPGYLGSLLVWTGAASSRNLLSIGAVTVLLAVAYGYRIHMEERMLVEALGQPYEDYRRRSWRLLPFMF